MRTETQAEGSAAETVMKALVEMENASPEAKTPPAQGALPAAAEVLEKRRSEVLTARTVPVDAVPVYPVSPDGVNAKVRYGEKRVLNLRPGTFETTTVELAIELPVENVSETITAARRGLAQHVHAQLNALEKHLRKHAAPTPSTNPFGG